MQYCWLSFFTSFHSIDAMWKLSLSRVISKDLKFANINSFRIWSLAQEENGWHHNQGSKYRVEASTPLDYSGAVERCFQMDSKASLVTIDEELEFEYINLVISQQLSQPALLTMGKFASLLMHADRVNKTNYGPTVRKLNLFISWQKLIQKRFYIVYVTTLKLTLIYTKQ